jgi:hypothetical protein
LRFQELKGSSRFFTFLSLPFPTFFLRLPVASVVSFQVPFKGGEAGNTRFFGKILPNGVEIFSKTEGSTFYFQSPLPYLCTCTITIDAIGKTMWRKENQSGNEMINFCEVFGLHDYRILISEKWIQLRFANVLEKWKLYMLEHAKQNCTANQGMVFLLIG